MSPASPEAQSRERSRLVRLAVLVGSLDRVVTLANALVRVGLLAYLLSNRDYGLYVAVLGVVTTAHLLDFGLHYGVVSDVSRAAGHDDVDRIRSTLSTGAFAYSAIAGLAFVIAMPFFAFGPIGWVLGLQADQVNEARWIAVLGFGGLLLSLPTKVAGAGLMGLQLSYVVSGYRSLSGLAQTALLATTALVWRGQLLPLALATAVTDIAGGAVLTLWAARRFSDRFRLAWAAVDRSLLRPLLATGVTFFFTNLANLFRRSFVTVAVSHSLGTAAVPAFSVPLALFSAGLAFTDVVGASLWPAYGEAVARRDWGWIERAFTLSVRAGLLAAFGIAALGLSSGDEVVGLWAAKVPRPPPVILVGLGVWMISQAATSATGSLVNGLRRNDLVMVVVFLEGIVTFAAVSLLVRTHGVPGVAVAMGISGAVGAVVLTLTALKVAAEGRLRFGGRILIPLAIGAAAAALAGHVAQGLFVRTVPRLVLGASVTASVYIAFVWRVVMIGAERERVTGAFRRLMRRKGS